MRTVLCACGGYCCSCFNPEHFFPLIFGFSYRANWEEWEPQQFGESGQCQITQHLVRQGKNLNRLIDQREFRQGGDVV